MSSVQGGDLSVTALASAMRARGSPRGVKRSMSRKRKPCDTAVIERFYNLHRWRTTLANVSSINANFG